MKVLYWSKEKKVNFVDDNNVFVGFDMEAQCCESFGWYIAKEITIKEPFTSLQ